MRKLCRWIAGALALALIATGIFLSPGGTPSMAVSPAPPRPFPVDKVPDVAINLSPGDLEALLANGAAETEYAAGLTWNEQVFSQVSVRTKGNSSLRSVASSNSKRFSFKVDLNQFVPGQSLDGITTINLNNNFSDPSYLRELLSYEAMASIGVPTPKTTWVRLTINGELWGLYLAVEQIGKPFLERSYGNGEGDLYKPESMGNGQGADLKWYGDNITSYPGIIYKNTDKPTDHQPLLQMLNALNNGGDLEKHLDVDGILKYFAASTVLANFDSYQGNMMHNYYLYEQNGRFTVIPWDFNMSFAGFGMGANTEAMTTVKIDEPTIGPLADKPLLAKLLAVPAYAQRYHGYIKDLITGYLEPDRFEARAREVTALIDPYVKEDPTKFYTYEQFQQALDAAAPSGAQPQAGQGRMNGGDRTGGTQVGLVTFVRARVANVKQQLDGTLPSKGDGSGIAGGGGPGGGGRPPGGQRQPGPRGPGGQFQPPGGNQPPDGPFAPSDPTPDTPSNPTTAYLTALALLLGATALMWRLRPRT